MLISFSVEDTKRINDAFDKYYQAVHGKVVDNALRILERQKMEKENTNKDKLYEFQVGDKVSYAGMTGTVINNALQGNYPVEISLVHSTGMGILQTRVESFTRTGKFNAYHAEPLLKLVEKAKVKTVRRFYQWVRIKVTAMPREVYAVRREKVTKALLLPALMTEDLKHVCGTQSAYASNVTEGEEIKRTNTYIDLEVDW